MLADVARFFTRQRLRRWIVAASIALVAWLLVSFVAAYQLTHRRRGPVPEPMPSVTWGKLQAHRIATRDGEELGAWYAEGTEHRPSVLLLHGSGGTRWNCLNRAGLLAGEAGCAVLLITLRAHGDSSGQRNDIGYGARRDVVAGVDFLKRRRPAEPVIILGTSMGAAAAVFAAEELAGLVRGYILESPYQDLKTAVWHRVEQSLPPVLDRMVYLGLRIVAPAVLPHLEDIAPIRAIDRIPADVPILILTGDADPLARPAEAQALFDRVRSHARLQVFPGAGHCDLLCFDPKRYTPLILDFCTAVRGLQEGDLRGHRSTPPDPGAVPPPGADPGPAR